MGACPCTHMCKHIHVCLGMCAHSQKHTNKSIKGADVLAVFSSLPPLLASHSGVPVIPLRYLRPCVMQWRHWCHPEIFPRQSHRASDCNYFCTSPPQQPSALASLWITNHTNQEGIFTHVVSQRDQLAAVFRMPRKTHHSVTFPL